MKWVLILIVWVGPKVNGLDLGSGLGPNRLGCVGPKINGFGPNRLGWA